MSPISYFAKGSVLSRLGKNFYELGDWQIIYKRAEKVSKLATRMRCSNRDTFLTVYDCQSPNSWQNSYDAGKAQTPWRNSLFAHFSKPQQNLIYCNPPTDAVSLRVTFATPCIPEAVSLR